MTLVGINWFAIITAVAANLLLGYLWYGPFFGKTWLKAIGKKEVDTRKSKVWIIWLGISSFILAIIIWNLLQIIDRSFFTTMWWIWLAFTYLPSFAAGIIANREEKLLNVETFFTLAASNITGIILIIFSLISRSALYLF